MPTDTLNDFETERYCQNEPKCNGVYYRNTLP